MILNLRSDIETEKSLQMYEVGFDVGWAIGNKVGDKVGFDAGKAVCHEVGDEVGFRCWKSSWCWWWKSSWLVTQLEMK